jgi:hypothetical protein
MTDWFHEQMSQTLTFPSTGAAELSQRPAYLTLPSLPKEVPMYSCLFMGYNAVGIYHFTNQSIEGLRFHGKQRKQGVAGDIATDHRFKSYRRRYKTIRDVCMVCLLPECCCFRALLRLL